MICFNIWVEIKESVSLKIFMSREAVKEYNLCNFHCNFFATNEDTSVLPGWIKHYSLVGWNLIEHFEINDWIPLQSENSKSQSMWYTRA